MDELNSLAKDLGWGARLRNAENFIHPPETKRKRFTGWSIAVAFIAGIAMASMVYVWKEPIADWINGLLGL